MTYSLTLAATLLTLPMVCAAAASQNPAMADTPAEANTSFQVQLHSDHLAFEAWVGFQALQVRLDGPGPISDRRLFTKDMALVYPIPADGPDGTYSYQATLIPLLSDSEKEQRQAIPDSERGLRPVSTENNVVEGSFVLYNGSAFAPSGVSPDRDVLPDQPVARGQVILDDLIVNGSACVGQDCANGESFGTDTLRLKENNLRIHFHDTSNSASFPSNDWRIVINDTTNGGDAYFAVEDVSTGRRPFRVDAGAPANALRINSSGNIGLGEDNPVVQIHLTDGNTPTLRLEQDGSSGFAAQTWDVAGNEANFFVRDVTNGSKLSFKIKPNAPENSLFVENNTGDIGFGTASPSAALHARRSGVAERTMLALENQGKVNLDITDFDSDADFVWRMTVQSDLKFQSITNGGADTADLAALDSSGNMVLGGTLAQLSSRSAKHVQPLDTGEVLARVQDLPLYTWRYRRDPSEQQHVGPTAEDFHQRFRLGPDARHLAPSDLAGVALAAVQALDDKLRKKDRELQQLKDRLARLESRSAVRR